MARVALCCWLNAWPVLAHEPILLDARRATAGLRLELRELPSNTGSAVVRYRLKAVGLPPGQLFEVWMKDFGHSFHDAGIRFQIDGSGEVVSSEPGASGRPRSLDEMTLEPGPYPRGSVWEVALVSVDRTLTAFAKVIPHPIAARDGSCMVSLELVSHRGERFMASGAGFTPGDDVTTESRYSGRVIEKRRRISSEGRLPPDVISHGSGGTDHRARYAVKGRSCEVAVEYEWGEPALSRH